MARDPLDVLARLRRLEVAQARRDLAGRAATLDEAAVRAEAVERALEAERAHAPADYAAFLPRALAAREDAARSVRRAQAALEVARIALADRRAQERAVERLAEARAEAARDAAARREQAALDDRTPSGG
jgi:flagellar export protein FliJ